LNITIEYTVTQVLEVTKLATVIGQIQSIFHTVVLIRRDRKSFLHQN